ncbi:hypothetical protein [Actinoplanes sp. NPDC026619]|uniref:hypothetical protein n=1 Tax=Actinoplanes sp. NPDC026619 TaxID=3155798 RepID=UPI00340BA0EE
MKPHPKHAVIALAVLGVLVGGCGAPSDRTPVPPAATTPAVEATTEAALEPTATAAVAVLPKPKATTARATPKPTTPKPKPKPTTAKPKPKPTTAKPKPTTKPTAGGQAVHPGAFCSPEGATGHTTKGTLMRCTLKSGEDRARWRKA